MENSLQCLKDEVRMNRDNKRIQNSGITYEIL